MMPLCRAASTIPWFGHGHSQWGSREGCGDTSHLPHLSPPPLLPDGTFRDRGVEEEDEVMSMGGSGEARRAMLMLLVVAVNNTRLPLKSSVLPAPRSLDCCKAALQEFEGAAQDHSFSGYGRVVEERGSVRMGRLPCCVFGMVWFQVSLLACGHLIFYLLSESYRSTLIKFCYLLKQRFIVGFFLAAIPCYVGAFYSNL